MFTEIVFVAIFHRHDASACDNFEEINVSFRRPESIFYVSSQTNVSAL